MGEPYLLTDEMWNFLLWFYRVKDDAAMLKPGKGGKMRSAWRSAFYYRRGQLVRPQKWGKGPFSAAIICLEGVGPARFNGWAQDGDAYVCADWGCDCGFVYEYEEGDPMGVPWPTPLIQIVASSEEQADNVYSSLLPMIQLSPTLSELIPDAGRSRILLPNGGKILTTTASSNSRLGQRVTFIVWDEVGTWTSAEMHALAVHIRRNNGGMGGRILETTNAWDPAQNSVAQKTYEAQLADLLIDFRQADPKLDYLVAEERRLIHEYVYGDCHWVDLDRIEAEALEIIKDDPANAERFFGNRIVAGKGTFISVELWATRTVLDEPTNRITLGFDGSISGDWTAIRACDDTGLRFTPTFPWDGREVKTIWNPDENRGQIPREQVRAAVAHLFRKYNVVRMVCDPFEWESQIDEWAAAYGSDKIAIFHTNSRTAMWHELVRYKSDMEEHETEHIECKVTQIHAGNAVMVTFGVKEYILGKPKGAKSQKIDALMADVLAYKAFLDALAAGLFKEEKKKYWHLE